MIHFSNCDINLSKQLISLKLDEKYILVGHGDQLKGSLHIKRTLCQLCGALPEVRSDRWRAVSRNARKLEDFISGKQYL